MAYKNLLNLANSSKQDFFINLRDFLCSQGAYITTGIGWTLFDSQYAVSAAAPQLNDWFVIYSAGESGEDDLYFKVTWSNGALSIWGYQSWNPATNTGANAYGTTFTMSLAEAISSSNPSWFYGDLDFILIVNETSSGIYAGDMFGKASNTYQGITGEVAICSTTLAAGSDVSIALDKIPAEWGVGREIFIRTTHTNNTATVEIEKITIKTIVGNTITADLVNAYTTGAKLTNHIGYFAQNSSNVWSTTQGLISPSGAQPAAVAWAYNTAYTLANYDPESFDRTIMLYDTQLTCTEGAFGLVLQCLKTPNHNAEFTSLDTIQEATGNTYRCFKLTSNTYVAVKEV